MSRLQTCAVLALYACGNDPGDTGDPDEPEVVRSVDLTDATALVFVRPDLERTAVQSAGQTELYKVLPDGTLERLFPEGWIAEEYGQGPTRFLVRLQELHWFEAIDPEAAHEGLWCRFVSFPLDEPGEAPLTCHLPLELLDDCDAPGADPSELGQCWWYPRAYDIGPDDTVWALWEADSQFDVYAWTDTEAIRATPAGVLEADLSGGPAFATVEGGVLMNGIDVGLETYWLREGGGADLALIDGVRLFAGGGTRTYPYQGRVLAWTYDGDGVFDAPTRSFVPFLDFATFEGATPSNAPVIDLYDAGRVYLRAGTSEPYQAFLCDEDAHCAAIPEDDPRRLALLGATYTLSDGVVTYLRSSTGEYFMAGEVISDELGAQWTIADVRLLGGKLHFESVDASNTAHLYRVDFADGAFTYTESATWGPETTAVIPLAWPTE